MFNGLAEDSPWNLPSEENSSREDRIPSPLEIASLKGV